MPAEPFSSCRRSDQRLGADHGNQLVRQGKAHRRGGFRYGDLVQQWITRRAFTLGADPRPARSVRHPSLVMHRPYRRAGSDHFVVCKALADGGYLSRSAAAPRLREPEELVGKGDPEDRSGAVGSVLPGYSVRTPADGARLGHRSPNGLVPQELSDLL